MTLETQNLEIIKNEGRLSFLYKKQGFGKDFKTEMELLGTINELFKVSDKTFTTIIKEVSLKKLIKENNFDTVVSKKNLLKASIHYYYIGSDCFDGNKDFCSLIGKIDPFFSINYSASGTPIINDTQI
jgi:hypothetical protein